MRLFIMLAALIVATAVYDIGGREMPWPKALGFAGMITLAIVLDAAERKGGE